MAIGNNSSDVAKLIELATQIYKPGQLEDLRKGSYRLWLEALLAITNECFGYGTATAALVRGDYVDHLGYEGSSLNLDDNLEMAAHSQIMAIVEQQLNAQDFIEWTAWRAVASRRDEKEKAARYFRAALFNMEHVDEMPRIALDRVIDPGDDRIDKRLPDSFSGHEVGARCVLIIELAALGELDKARTHLQKMKAEVRFLKKRKAKDSRAVALTVEAISMWIDSKKKTDDAAHLDKFLSKVARAVKLFEKSLVDKDRRDMTDWNVKSYCAAVQRIGAEVLRQQRRMEEVQVYCKSAKAKLNDILDECLPEHKKNRNNSLSDEMRVRIKMLNSLTHYPESLCELGGNSL